MNETQFLKQKRMQAGLTQRQVARRLKYRSSQFISNWERGLANAPIFVLRKLCEIYKIDPREMYRHRVETMTRELKKELGMR